MPYAVVQEVELYDDNYQELLNKKRTHESAITVLEEQKKRVINYRNNVEVIQQLAGQINELVNGDINHDLIEPRKIDPEKAIFGYSEGSSQVYIDLQNQLRNNAVGLARCIEQLSAMGERTPTKWVLKDIRKMLNSRRYISSGSVKVVKKDGTNDYYLKFTMSNVCVQPHKTLSELKTQYPTRPLLSAIEGVDDRPSLLLPRLNFTVNLRDKTVTITRGRDKNPIKFNGYPHPHYHTGICLGSFTDAFVDAVEQRDVSSIVGVLRTWAGVATVYEDYWGTSFMNVFHDMVPKYVKGTGIRYVTESNGQMIAVKGGIHRPIKWVEHADRPGAYDIILPTLGSHEEERYVFTPYEL